MKRLKKIKQLGSVPDTLLRYASRFDPKEMWEKISSSAGRAGQEVVMMVLTMYYTIESSVKDIRRIRLDGSVGIKDILILAGAIAYFVIPTDLIPDFLPMGFADDIAALTAAFKSGKKIFSAISVEKAEKKTHEIMGDNFDEATAVRMVGEIINARKNGSKD